MAKIPKEEWLKYKDLEFYPDRVCGCLCKGKIPVRSSHYFDGIPIYLRGHCPRSEETKTKMRISALKKPPVSKETIAKQSAYWTFEICEEQHYLRIGKKRPDIDKESIRIGKGKVYPGPDWYLTFRDFVKSACYMYEIQYMRASTIIRKRIKEKGLSRFDIVIFLNWSVGHNQFELAEEYSISTKDVKGILKRMYVTFPTVFQEGTSAPVLPRQSLEEWMPVKKDF